LLSKVRASYGADRQLFVIWDNWPVHWQADVLTKAGELNIHLLWLPTYAPWTNPIEKLWRWLKQEVLHNHQLAEHFDTLKEQARTFLNRFTHGSTQLLRYVGLLPLPYQVVNLHKPRAGKGQSLLRRLPYCSLVPGGDFATCQPATLVAGRGP
jgi:hypothetical protein